MTEYELKDVLEEYQLTETGLVNCINEIIKVNKRIDKSYKEVGFDWKKLSIFTVRRILETYNKSIINIKTGEIISVDDNSLVKNDFSKLFKVLVNLEFNSKFPGGTVDVDMFAIAKKKNGHFSAIYYNNPKEPGIELIDWREFKAPLNPEIQPDEIISVNLDEVEKDVNQILFLVYIYNDTKPKDAFSSMKFSLLDEKDKIISEIDVTDEINHSIGVAGFEFIREDSWKVRILAEDLNYDINKLISTL